MDLAIMIHSIQCIVTLVAALIQPGPSRTVRGHACTSSKFIKAIYFQDSISIKVARERNYGFNDRFLGLCHAPESRSIPTTAKSRPLWPPFTFSSPATRSSLPSPTTASL